MKFKNTVLNVFLLCFISCTTTHAQTIIKNESWKQTTLSTAEKKNLATALHFMANGIGKADMKVFDECIALNAKIYTGLKPGGPIDGLQEYKQTFEGFASAWPVNEFIIDEAFATDDKVVIRFQAVAHFKNDYYGVKATNEIVNMKEVHVLTLKNGKIITSVVSGTNFPFEYIMYPVLKNAVIGNLPKYKG